MFTASRLGFPRAARHQMSVPAGCTPSPLALALLASADMRWIALSCLLSLGAACTVEGAATGAIVAHFANQGTDPEHRVSAGKYTLIGASIGLLVDLVVLPKILRSLPAGAR